MDQNGTLIVSDAHLGAAPLEHEDAFRRFLARAADRTRDLVINGDLFDFWFEYGVSEFRGADPTRSREPRLLGRLVSYG